MAPPCCSPGRQTPASGNAARPSHGSRPIVMRRRPRMTGKPGSSKATRWQMRRPGLPSRCTRSPARRLRGRSNSTSPGFRSLQEPLEQRCRNSLLHQATCRGVRRREPPSRRRSRAAINGSARGTVGGVRSVGQDVFNGMSRFTEEGKSVWDRVMTRVAASTLLRDIGSGQLTAIHRSYIARGVEARASNALTN